jgi:hypothetical protein
MLTAEDRIRQAIGWIIFGAVLFVIGMIGLVVALADEPHKHRPQDLDIHYKFYNTWKMPSNREISCCHEQDCAPAEARQLSNGQWEARQLGDTGNFTPIPPEKVEYDRDSPDGRNHLCGRRLGIGNDFYVYCFIAANGG